MASITSYYQNKTKTTPSASNGNAPITPTSKVTGNGITSYYKNTTTQKKTVPVKTIKQTPNFQVTKGASFSSSPISGLNKITSNYKPTTTQNKVPTPSSIPQPDFKTINATRDVYSPVTPILQQTTISQAPKEKEKNIWQKVTGFIDRVFNGSEKEQDMDKIARATNAYNILKVSGQQLVETRVKELSKQQNISYKEGVKLTEGLARESGKSVYDVVGLSLTELNKPGGNPWKNSLMENVTKEVGIRIDPTNSEVVSGLMTLSILIGLGDPSILPKVGTKVATRIDVLKGIGKFVALEEVKSGIISKVKGEGFKFGTAYTLSDLYKGENRSVISFLDTIDFLLVGGALAGLYKGSPKVTEGLTKDFIKVYKLPKTIKIEPKVVREVVIGANDKYKYEADILASLKLDSKAWKQASKQGITIDVPAERLIYVADKPYWTKLKSVIGKTSEQKLVSKVVEGKTQQGVAGLLEKGKTTTISTATKDTRPSHQALLEKAFNSGNKQEVNRILDSIPANDPYKKPMEKLFRDKPMTKVVDSTQEVRNKANNILKSKGTEPLLEQAKQAIKEGKSAEDFVKAQKVLYRAGKLDVTKNTEQGISLTLDPLYAETFSKTNKKKTIEELYINPDAKILTKIPERFKTYGKSGVLFSKDGELLEMQGKEEFQNIVDYATREGYDAVDLSGFNAPKGELGEAEIRVINPSIIKTKTQLADIYNQAKIGVQEGYTKGTSVPQQLTKTTENFTNIKIEGRDLKQTIKDIESDINPSYPWERESAKKLIDRYKNLFDQAKRAIDAPAYLAERDVSKTTNTVYIYVSEKLPPSEYRLDRRGGPLTLITTKNIDKIRISDHVNQSRLPENTNVPDTKNFVSFSKASSYLKNKYNIKLNDDFRGASPKLNGQVIDKTTEDLTQELKDTYAKVGEPVEQALSEVYAEMKMAEAGKRHFTEDGVIGQKSSFPDWIPEEYRKKMLFDKVLGGLKQVSDIKYPDKNSPRLRAFYDALLDEVDSRAGVNTSKLRSDIISSNEARKIKQPKILDDRGTERSQESIKQEKPPKQVSTGDEIKPDEILSFSGGNASVGKFSETKVKLGELDQLRPAEFPELVRLAKELIDGEQIGTKYFPKANGMFYEVDNGKIMLNRKLFEENNLDQLSKTLAHEIGHLVDYLPEKTLARGNLLGRLNSLSKFVKGTFSTRENYLETESLTLEKKELQLQRREIKKTTQDKNKDLVLLRKIREINKRLNELDKGAIKNKDILKELKAFSEAWRPYDKATAPASFKQYRNSSKELYADSISGLLTNPGLLEEKAPIFYKQFFEALDNKPEVRDEYFKLQDLLKSGSDAVLEERLNAKYKGYEKAKQKRVEIENKIVRKPRFMDQIMQQHITAFDPIYKKIERQITNKGVSVSIKENTRMKLEAMQMVSSDQYLYLDKLNNDIVIPLENIGVTENEFGAILELERNLHGRKDIANPDGLSSGYAEETLAKLRENYTPSQTEVIDQVMAEYRRENFKWVKRLYETGRISKEVWDEKIQPNQNNYVTFQVLKYIEDNYVSAGVKKATGTLSQIENPIVSTALKTLSTIRESIVLEAKNEVVKLHKEYFSDDIELAVPQKVQGTTVGFKFKKDFDVLEVYEDGKRVGYYVDPYINKMFETHSAEDMHSLVKASSQFNRVFKPIVTTYNLSWGLYSNIIRDSSRTYKNLSAILPEYGKNITLTEYIQTWIKSIPEGSKYQKRELNTLTKEMLSNKAFSIPFTEFDPNANQDAVLAPVLRKYNYFGSNSLEQTSIRHKLLKYPIKLLRGIEFVGGTLESTSKITAYQIVKKRISNGEKAGFIVRNYTGTPNYMDGGTMKSIDNNVFVFSNVMIQGLRSDFEIATNPKTRAGWWFKTFQVNIVPKLLMVAAGAGLFGAKVKSMMDKATEYDKTNYIVVPLGEDENGKAVYWRVPQDETGRFFSAVLWKTANALQGKATKTLQVIDVTAGWFVPSTTPLYSIMGGWFDYIKGRNPYDSYRGRPVIDQTTFQAGGLPSVTKMVQWTINEMGLASFNTYDNARESGLEAKIQAIPIVSRAFKVSDYGLTEQEREIDRKIRKEKAKQTLSERELVDKYIKEGRKLVKDSKELPLLEDKLVLEIITPLKEQGEDISSIKSKANTIRTKFKIGVLKSSASRELTSLIDADTNDYKLELLNLYKKQMSSSEYTELLTTAYKYKILSSNIKAP